MSVTRSKATLRSGYYRLVASLDNVEFVFERVQVLRRSVIGVVPFPVVRVQLQDVLDAKRWLLLGVRSNLTTTNELRKVAL